MLVHDGGDERDKPKDDAGNVGDDDGDVALGLHEAVDGPHAAVEERAERLPRAARVAAEVVGDLREVGHVHDHREDGGNAADDGDDVSLFALLTLDFLGC